METLDELLVRAEQSHGHMCAGQVLGVRMAMRGCQAVGINDPRGDDRKNLIVFVEIDRCAADAINTVTGCRLGKRTLKYYDYGKLAATFLNIQTGNAVRVVACDTAREAADRCFPEIANKYQRQLYAYKQFPDDELFTTERVTVNFRPEDQPGRPVSRISCEACGESVNDRREVKRDGRTLCRACAGDSYYTRLRS
ncbi:MAG TPA: FmdE family protein [Blastocatellia bacterium]|nr:FmdE family protein [Blastocatellia bacterium]